MSCKKHVLGYLSVSSLECLADTRCGVFAIKQGFEGLHPHTHVVAVAMLPPGADFPPSAPHRAAPPASPRAPPPASPVRAAALALLQSSPVAAQTPYIAFPIGIAERRRHPDVDWDELLGFISSGPINDFIVPVRSLSSCLDSPLFLLQLTHPLSQVLTWQETPRACGPKPVVKSLARAHEAPSFLSRSV